MVSILNLKFYIYVKCWKFWLWQKAIWYNRKIKRIDKKILGKIIIIILQSLVKAWKIFSNNLEKIKLKYSKIICKINIFLLVSLISKFNFTFKHKVKHKNTTLISYTYSKQKFEYSRFCY